ncbi:MAG: DnaD domain protein [Aristaeellaceae bacterium]
MFGFDERYAVFDVTPVDNQFILEYLPAAKGDYVKVYLYGLTQCCHPQADMDMASLSRELGMTEDEVQSAYRYWERKGLVQRISDHPPAYRYINVKQLMFSGVAAQADPAYEAFSEALYGLFNNQRQLHGKEIQLCYEWVEDMGLPQEVVLALLRHMIDAKGMNFTFKSAQKLAVELAEQGVATAEDATAYLQLEKDILRGGKAVLQRMGQYRNPTVDELNLYRKWVKEWGFKPDAVLEACADTTGGKPSFKYLDGILNRYREQDAASGAALRQTRQRSRDAITPLKKLIGLFNNASLTVNEETKAQYARMRALYPDGIILLAGRECVGRGQPFEQVMSYLEAWQRLGLQTEQDVRAYMQTVNRQNAFLSQLYHLWGKDSSRPTAADRTLLTRWTEQWKFTEDVIVAAASQCARADKPMAYLDKLLEGFVEKHIDTPEAVAADHEQWQQQKQQGEQTPARPVKTVREQQYTQRPYEDSDELPAWMLERLKEMKDDA